MSAGDLVDRMDDAQSGLLDAMAVADWNPPAPALLRLVLGRFDDGIERVLRFAATEVVPRIRRTPDELRTSSPR